MPRRSACHLTARPHHSLQNVNEPCNNCGYRFLVFYLGVPKHTISFSLFSSGCDQSTFSEFTIIGYNYQIMHTVR